jgi:hypothetical protein
VTEDRPVATKPTLPESIANHRQAFSSSDIFLRGERSSDERRHAKHREKASRHAEAEHRLRLVAAREVRTPVLGGRDVGEAACLILPVDDVRRGDWILTVVQDDDQAITVGVGQWPEQYTIDDAEDRGRRSDAKREPTRMSPRTFRTAPSSIARRLIGTCAEVAR